MTYARNAPGHLHRPSWKENAGGAWAFIIVLLALLYVFTLAPIKDWVKPKVEATYAGIQILSILLWVRIIAPVVDWMKKRVFDLLLCRNVVSDKHRAGLTDKGKNRRKR